MHLEAERIGQREYWIMYTGENDDGSHIWQDFIQLLCWKFFQLGTAKQCENIFGQNKKSYREGDSSTLIKTSEGNPH